MKKSFSIRMTKGIAAAAVLAVAGFAGSAPAGAEDVKIGMLQGFTGPTESLVKPMAQGGELAIQEVSDSGLLLGGRKVVSIRGDSTCIDAAAATSAAERLLTVEGVHGVVGATCSGATTAILNNVARPNGMVMISPSATSPALSTIEDDGYFFRTAPSDARQGVVVAEILMDNGVKSAAMTYTNNDYGKGLADAIEASFKAKGGKITLVAAHEDGKADYSAEIGTLAAAGGDVLIVAGYLDQGGRGMIQAALDTGAFDRFFLPDGMVGESLSDHFGKNIEGSMGSNPGSDSPGAAALTKMSMDKGFKGDDPFVPEAYDASAVLLLAMQAAKSDDPAKYKSKVMDVANAPGEKIYPGELAKALRILSEGGEIDYVGASGVELIGPGEAAGNYRESMIKGGVFETVKYR